MGGADSPRGFDATHSRHVNIHQHDPSITVPNQLNRGFSSLAFAGDDEVLRGSDGSGGSQPETGLVVDHPHPHPLVRHSWHDAAPICRTPWCTHHTFHGVYITLLSRGGVEEHQHSLD